MIPRRIEIFLIGKEGESDGANETRSLFSEVSRTSLVDIDNIDLKDLPYSARKMLTDPQRLGLGEGENLSLWVSHLRAWERIATSKLGWGLVLEGGTRPRGFNRLFRATVPEDADLIWINRSMAPSVPAAEDGGPQIVPIKSFVKDKIALPPRRAAPGSDGYILSRDGAQKLIEAVDVEGMNGSIEWRLLRYAMTEDYAREICNSWWSEKGRGLFSFDELIGWDKVNAYAISPGIVS